MFEVVDSHVFPFIREEVAKDGAVARHMKDARFGIPTPALLAKVVDKLDKIEMADRDTKGDVYEYMLAKIASAGQNGQFRTPRHIIQLMVEMTRPTPKDTICDSAAGTCGFLVAAAEYLRTHHAKLFRDDALRRHFHEGAFHGFDFDPTTLRIGSMNMILHGIENPAVEARDALSEELAGEAARYSLVLANPPFAGSLDYESTAKDLQQIVKTRKTELLFLALFLRLLKTGGRAAVIVPDGVLFGSSTAHKAIRRALVEEHRLEAVVKLPSGVFRPYAGVSTAILLFTKTGVGGTEDVWFYGVEADGWSLDDKRTPLLAEEKLGPVPGGEGVRPLAQTSKQTLDAGGDQHGAAPQFSPAAPPTHRAAPDRGDPRCGRCVAAEAAAGASPAGSALAGDLHRDVWGPGRQPQRVEDTSVGRYRDAG
jgi:type I restriction enzyme M protein